MTINHFTGNSRSADMSESQDDKYLTHNQHCDMIADRTQRKMNLYVGISSGSRLTLGSADFTENVVFHLRAEPGSPTLDGDFELRVPAIQSRFAVFNDTGYSCYVECAGSPGSIVTVLDGGRADLHCDGQTVMELKRDIYDLNFFVGTWTEGEMFGSLIAVRAFTLPAGLALSKAYAYNPSAGGEDDRVISIQKNEVEIGTCTFSAASSTGTFSFASEVSFVANDRLRLVNSSQSPTTSTTLANVNIVLAGVAG